MQNDNSQYNNSKNGDPLQRTLHYLQNVDKKKLAISNILTIALIAFVIYASFTARNFFSINTVFAVVNNMASVLPMAIGMGLIMIVGGTDLSAGRASGFVGVIAASLLFQLTTDNQIFPNIAEIPIIVPIIISIIVGALISSINALMILKLKVHPFILTLAMSMVLQGIMFWYLGLGTNANKSISIVVNTPYYDLINSGFVVNTQKLYYFVFVIIVLVVAMWIVMNKTPIGRSMYAVGCNREAATVTGISIFKTTLIVFAIAGALFGLTGFIKGAQSSNGLNSGNGLDLNAIAACIIGGVSFAGGIGKIRGILFGVFLMELVSYALIAMRIDSTYISLITGAIIIIAVSIDMIKVRQSK